MHFGDRLKQILLDRNMTQLELSKSIDYHKGMISNIINGKRPSGEFIMKIVAFFPDKINYLFADVTNSDMVEEDGNSYPSPPNATKIIMDIEVKLGILKKILSQK